MSGIIAGLVAESGTNIGLELPKGNIPARTRTAAVKQRQGIAKKFLNTWLSKLRTKYRPEVCGSNKRQKKTAHKPDDTRSNSAADLTDHEGD